MTGFYNRVGIKEVHLVYFITVFSELFKELNTVPLIALLNRQTPQHIEATAISFYASFISLSRLLSTLLGAGLGYLFDVQNHNYTQMYPIVLIQCLYTTVTTLGLFMIKFPKGSGGDLELNDSQVQEGLRKVTSSSYGNEIGFKRQGIDRNAFAGGEIRGRGINVFRISPGEENGKIRNSRSRKSIGEEWKFEIQNETRRENENGSVVKKRIQTKRDFNGFETSERRQGRVCDFQRDSKETQDEPRNDPEIIIENNKSLTLRHMNETQDPRFKNENENADSDTVKKETNSRSNSDGNLDLTKMPSPKTKNLLVSEDYLNTYFESVRTLGLMGRPSSRLSAGFRVGNKNQSFSYSRLGSSTLPSSKHN